MADSPVSEERGYAGLRPNPLPPEDQGRLRELAEQFGIPERADDLLAMSQNGILLRPDSGGEGRSLERTRTAGSLSLPADFRWPHIHYGQIDIDDHVRSLDDLRPLGAVVCQCDWSAGLPLETDKRGRLVHRDRLPAMLYHLIQLDLAELAPYDINGLLPRTGLLQIFTARLGGDAVGVGIGHVEYLPDGDDPALAPFDLRGRAATDPALSAACERGGSWPHEHDRQAGPLIAERLSTLPVFVGPLLAGGRPDEDDELDDEDWLDDEDRPDDEPQAGLSEQLGGRDWPGDELGAQLSVRRRAGFGSGEYRLLGHPQDFHKEFYGGYPWSGLDPTMPKGAQMLLGWIDEGSDSAAYVYIDDDALARGDFSQVTVEYTQR